MTGKGKLSANSSTRELEEGLLAAIDAGRLDDVKKFAPLLWSKSKRYERREFNRELMERAARKGYEHIVHWFVDQGIPYRWHMIKACELYGFTAKEKLLRDGGSALVNAIEDFDVLRLRHVFQHGGWPGEDQVYAFVLSVFEDPTYELADVVRKGIDEIALMVELLSGSRFGHK